MGNEATRLHSKDAAYSSLPRRNLQRRWRLDVFTKREKLCLRSHSFHSAMKRYSVLLHNMKHPACAPYYQKIKRTVPYMGRWCGESVKTFFPEKRSRTSASLFFFPCPAIALATVDLTHFKKSEKLLIYFHLTLSGTELNKKRWFFRLQYIHCGKSETEFWRPLHKWQNFSIERRNLNKILSNNIGNAITVILY